MRGVNKVIIIGNATRDAELRHTQSGKAVSNLRIATNRTVNGQETTQFHSVVCWEKLAETTGLYVKKGQPVYVEGRLEYRTFQDNEGKDRGVVEIIASDVQFLGSRTGDGGADVATDSSPATEAVNLDDIPF